MEKTFRRISANPINVVFWISWELLFPEILLLSFLRSFFVTSHLCALKFFSVSINHILMIFIQGLYPSITFSGSWVKVFLSEGIGKSVRMYFFNPDLDYY